MLGITLKISIFLLFFVLLDSDLMAQSTEPKEELTEKKQEKTESFGEFVEKVGKSIWSRLNERFNLENTGKNLVDKKDKILSPFQKKKPEVPQNNTQEDKKEPTPKPEQNDP